MLIGLGLLASCSNNPDDRDEIPPQFDSNNSQSAIAGEDGYGFDIRLKGTYNVSWVVDRQEVDTATLVVGGTPTYMRISHFPMSYFLNLVGKKVDPADIIYTQGASDWKFDVGVVGFSANNAYLQNSVWAPQVSFQVNGEDYDFSDNWQKEIEDTQTGGDRATADRSDTGRRQAGDASPVRPFFRIYHGYGTQVYP